MVEEIKNAIINNQPRQSTTLGTMSMKCAEYYLRITAKSVMTTCRQFTVVALQAKKYFSIFYCISVARQKHFWSSGAPDEPLCEAVSQTFLLKISFLNRKEAYLWNYTHAEEMRSVISQNYYRNSVTLGTISFECPSFYLRNSAKSVVTTCRQYTVVVLKAEYYL